MDELDLLPEVLNDMDRLDNDNIIGDSIISSDETEIYRRDDLL